MAAQPSILDTVVEATQAATQALYAKISDPLAFAKEMGQSLMVAYGLTSPHHGTIMAITCMQEGISFRKYVERYHADGTMRATAIQAEFQSRGGKVEWVNLGDDGKESRAKFSHPSYQPTPLDVGYTIADAQKQVGEKFGKQGSNWQTNPGAMLRAALIRKAVKVICPGIVSGYDDFSDIEDSPRHGAAVQTQAASARKAELDAMAKETATAPAVSAPASTPTQPAVGKLIAEDEVPFDSGAPAATTTAATATSPSDLCTNDQLQELVALASKVPSPNDPSRGMNLAETAEGVRSACRVKEPAEATYLQISTLIERFRAQLGAK